VRLSPIVYRRLCLLALWSLCAIVVTGAAVRLSDSGLGCSDWPTCQNGSIVPKADVHALIEAVNRYITGLVSILVILAVAGSRRRTPRRSDLTRWSWSLVIGVVAQIIIGGMVVLTGLKYSFVAVHFLVSMALVWAAVVLVELAGRPDDAPPGQPWPRWARLLVAGATLVLLTGPLVSSAGPHTGTSADHHLVKRLPIDLEWVARVHSGSVWLFVAAIVATAWRLRGSPVQRRIVDLLVAAVAQGGIGYTQYFTGVPAWLVGIHVAGATLVWVMTLRVALASPSTVAVTDRPGELLTPAAR